MSSDHRLALTSEAADLDSDFDEEDDEVRQRREKKKRLGDLREVKAKEKVKRAKKEQFNDEVARDEGRRQRSASSF